MKAFSTKLTIETMIDADQRGPEAVHAPAEVEQSASQEVSNSISALITIRNSPRVSITTHAVTRVKIGFTIAFTTPKINATTSRVRTLRPWSARSG